MKVTISGSVLLGLASHALAAPASAQSDAQAADSRAQEVKSVFQESWAGYYRYAKGHDELHPQRKNWEDDRDGWGLTAFDALSTAIVMRDNTTVANILDIISKVDFSTTKKQNDRISVFETTIRYLGGMVASYDLLTGPYSDLLNGKSAKLLLDQAKTLADGLSVAFDTQTGIPDPTVYFNPSKRKSGTNRNNAAEIGTLILEWTRLSDLTGDGKYAKLAQKAEDYLLRPTGAPEAWPGLIGTWVGINDGKFQDSNGDWASYMDSFYEYLIKMYLFDPKSFSEHKDRWVKAADSTIAHLASHPSTRSDLTFLKSYSGQNTKAESEHLASFAGGNFILGGILLNEDKYINFGLQLAESYYQTYKTPSGIGPDGFQWVDAQQGGSSPPGDQAAFYKTSGFWASSPGWGLNPETMESLYYAYRVTGDRKYQDMAYEGFRNMKRVCKSGAGYSDINNVMDKNGGGFNDRMESFWLAETLKYMYLIFVEDSPVHVRGKGQKTDFVFNTEAHPIRVRH
ncbi:hypothetical protein LMH87_000570 [Akanthomyces muscarius]|uniref:alpha-1,2-Mannosidase n=1 Tax=Akanthomyces muscarius TaxID=2231603 RepID=A0A9W8UNX9_AKAMU|nr:hypothetical protein LMH87_000570 [Akanthomyces muscarius]KAJ4155316.1 hypothetical protein LMH87_000570 [Akanthomyces muscarius]